MIPQEIKKQQGTYRAHRDKNKDVEFDKVESISPPTFIKGESKKAFDILVGELGLNGYGLLTTLDAPAITLLADAYGEYIKVSKTIEKEGLVIEDYNNRNAIVQKPHPLLSYKRQLFKDITLMLKEFGCTPASRSKVEFKPASQVDDNDFNF
ncbi:phage terminase small subunit P27 family [Belliella sp. DSM 111904]|uniref:Phage terminase small subunit P27 family n=1 Tax=Belliella filtrata TaxID=2923435 RepID=A0ABS9V425_9BACT|nr:phage terminase small subunit P27 family [Belliella filtrata]MCH7411166.1 phage terminase small subunit P27 family [Belliella filtrata]